MAHPYAKYMQGGARAKAVAKGYAKGGAVKDVKIVINTGGDKSAPPPMPLPIPMGGPPPGPPGPPPGAPPMPMGKPPGMKRGGKVAMKAGAYSGEGRLQKIKAYGKRARGG